MSDAVRRIQTQLDRLSPQERVLVRAAGRRKKAVALIIFIACTEAGNSRQARAVDFAEGGRVRAQGRERVDDGERLADVALLRRPAARCGRSRRTSCFLGV